MEQRGQVRFQYPDSFSNLYHNAFVQRQLVALLYVNRLFPMRVTNEVSRHVVHHDAFVEGVKA
jgi:hypothetical protein